MKVLLNYIALLLVGFNSFGQVMGVKNYEVSDYLGQNSFYDLAQDQNLNIYLGTDNGILQYDGNNFDHLIIDGLPQNAKIEHLLYNNGNLLFASGGKLYNYYLQKDSLLVLIEKPIKELAFKKGVAYGLTNNQLYAITGANLSSVKLLYTNESKSFNTLFFDGNKTVIGTNEGLLEQVNADNFEQVGSYIDVQGISKNYDSSNLILGRNKIFRQSGNNISPLISLDEYNLENFIVNALGEILISTRQGQLLKYNGTSTIVVDNNNGVRSFHINKLKLDKEDNLWLLGNKGLSKVNINQPIVHLKINDIASIFASDNELLISGDPFLKKYSSRNVVEDIDFTGIAKPEAISVAYVNSKWLILSDGKLFTLLNNNLVLLKQSIPFTHLYALKNTLYAANSSSEFFKLDTKTFTVIKKYTTGKIARILQKTDEITLVDENGVLNIIDSGSVLSTSNLKLKDKVSAKHLIYSSKGYLSFLKDSLIIIAKNKNIQRVNIGKLVGNSDLEIYHLFEDSNANVWLSTNKGVLRLTVDVSEGKVSIIESSVYTTDDNFLSTYFSAVSEMQNEELVFTHANGITIYNPFLDNPALAPPGVKLNKIIGFNFDEFNNAEDTVDILTDNTKLHYNNAVSISANAITHRNSYNATVLYRIKSVSDSWERINSGQTLTINDLPAGNNVLQFRAINASNVEGTAIETVEISVTAPFWQKIWFYGASLGFILLIGFISYRSVNNYKDSKTKELHDKLGKEISEMERRSHLQILKSERLKQLNDLILSQKVELEKKNKQIESQKYELSVTNGQIKQQKDLLEDTGSKLKASINYAQRIQDALMSTEVELKNALDQSFVYFQPRDVVSGDFFWFNKVTNDKGEEILIIAAVDCTGHGVPGAIVSVVGMNLLNNITNLKKVYEPGHILDELNADIIENLRQSETQVNDGMDMSLITINTTTKELKFAGAKNPLLYVEDNELKRIRGTKYAIGGQQRGDDRSYITHQFIHDGKERMFYIFSDGYQDQFGGEKGFKFLTVNFKELLFNISGKPMLDQKEILHDTIEDWKADYHQTDDILVIGFKF